MELKNMKNKLSQFVKKYRFVAIILLVGLVLMCIPRKTSMENDGVETEQKSINDALAVSLDAELGDILSRIEGAGNVHVLLTLRRGEETVYQTDTHTSVNADDTNTQVETVIISGSERDQQGLIRQVNPPVYMGAVIVCQGADKPAVRLAIVEAVSKVTGLGADRISVLKMK